MQILLEIQGEFFYCRKLKLTSQKWTNQVKKMDKPEMDKQSKLKVKTENVNNNIFKCWFYIF